MVKLVARTGVAELHYIDEETKVVKKSEDLFFAQV